MIGLIFSMNISKKNMVNGIIIDFKTQIVSNITYNTSTISVSVIPNCTVNINIYFCVRSGAIYKPGQNIWDKL